MPDGRTGDSQPNEQNRDGRPDCLADWDTARGPGCQLDR